MKALKIAILALAALFLVSFAGVSFYIAFYPARSDVTSPKYIGVVFGAGITKSSEPSTALRLRLDKAVGLYRGKKIQKIMISGKIAETYVMKNYLVKKKIPAGDIIVDYNGNNTYETVANVKSYLSKNSLPESVVFISQQYHIPRIRLIAEKIKFEGPEFISAERKNIDRDENIFFIFRESLAYEKTWAFDRNLK